MRRARRRQRNMQRARGSSSPCSGDAKARSLDAHAHAPTLWSREEKSDTASEEETTCRERDRRDRGLGMRHVSATNRVSVVAPEWIASTVGLGVLVAGSGLKSKDGAEDEAGAAD